MASLLLRACTGLTVARHSNSRSTRIDIALARRPIAATLGDTIPAQPRRSLLAACRAAERRQSRQA